MANAPLQPQLPWPALGFSQHASCCARGAIALPMRQQKRTWALELRTRARPGIRSGSAHVGTGAHAMQPNTAQQHARGATRTGMASDRRVCFRRGDRRLN